MISYPDYLPVPIQDGYDLNPVSPLLRTNLANGRARQRRRFTSVPTMANVRFRMRSGEAQLFERFFQDNLSDGAAWFDMPLKTPVGIKRYKARFTDIYSGPTLEEGIYWLFTAPMELFERPLIDSEWAEFPEFVLYSDIIDMAANREWPIA